MDKIIKPKILFSTSLHFSFALDFAHNAIYKCASLGLVILQTKYTLFAYLGLNCR